MKKLKFKYEGKTKSFDESTHAALFRAFFEYWKKTDLEKAILGTFESGLRLSEQEYYEGNVIKKKNLLVTGDLYVITHITPAIMDKGIIKFLEAVGAEIIEPKQKKPKNDKKDDKKDEKTEEEGPKPATLLLENPYDLEKFSEEIKQLASLVSNSGAEDEENTKRMAELVRKQMEIRDAKIKARLARGNREE